MEHDSRTEPLRTWNALARENTENAIVSSMFESLVASSEQTEKFSTWLLAGTAAIASFFIANADKLLPLVSRNGFRMCGLWLVLSCVFGLLARVFGIGVKIGSDSRAAGVKSFMEHMGKYKEDETKIKAAANSVGITLETGVRIERIMSEFYKPLPQWLARRIKKRIEKDSESIHMGHLGAIRFLLRQSLCASLQTVFFLFFLISGLAYAAQA